MADARNQEQVSVVPASHESLANVYGRYFGSDNLERVVLNLRAKMFDATPFSEVQGFVMPHYECAFKPSEML